MRREDLLAFVGRDWAAIEAAKARHWVDRKRRMSAAAALELGASLRRYALALRPDWPDDSDREADRESHRRVSEALRAAARVNAR